MKHIFIHIVIATVCALSFITKAYSQQDSLQNLKQLNEYVKKVTKKNSALSDNVDRHTQKTLNKLSRSEQKIYEKLKKSDSLLAKKLFPYAIDSLKKFTKFFDQSNFSNKLKKRIQYYPYLDTVKQALNFFKSKGNKILNISSGKDGLSEASSSMDLVEDKLQSVESLQEYLRERISVLKDHLGAFPELTKKIRGMSKEVYYYTAQITELKSIFADQSNLERVVVSALRNIPEFKDFMQSNSTLSNLFQIGGGPLPSTGNIPIVNGLASRASIQQSIQSGLGSQSGDLTKFLTTQLAQATSIPNELFKNINQNGGMGNKEMPDFKPNSQRTKSFLKRLEYGSDVQFGKSSAYFPATSTVGVTIAYKLNDKNMIGIGLNYRAGLGTGWKDIKISHQGIGFRTFANWKFKGNFFIQGGGEWNYNSQFRNIESLKNSLWQKSALLGVVKKYKISKKVNGKVELLYDFLHKQNKPNSQPVLFRIGYGL